MGMTSQPHDNGAPVTGTPAIAAEEIDAVVFDIGGVFAVRHPTPVRRGMARAGFDLPIEEDRYVAAHYQAVHRLASVPMDGRNEYDPEFWMHFERAYLASLDVAYDDIERGALAMRTEVFGKEPKPIWNLVLPHNVLGFHRIAAKWPVAIVTNNEGTAVQQMLDFGVCQLDDIGTLPRAAAIVDSAIVGITKPDPAIFAPALAALDVPAHRALYVGDTVHADVHGARAAGMQVVQLDPFNLHASYSHWRLPDVMGLADHLGCP
jgi:putative hydrolase of the HAD superfamily